MSFDYGAVRDSDVAPLIEEFGISATLIVKDNRFHDVDTGVETERSTSYIVKVVLDNQQKTYQAGKLITDVRKRAYISPKGMTVVPKANDELLINDETFKITQVIETKPADVAVLYEVVLEN